MVGLRNALIAVAAGAVGVALVGCGGTVSQHMSRDMSHQSGLYKAWWNQQVVYHTDTNVYFSPHSATYFWFGQGSWHESDSPPAHLTPNGDHQEIVRRSHLLRASKNSVEVQAFNPFFMTPTAEVEAAAFLEDPVTAVDGDDNEFWHEY